MDKIISEIKRQVNLHLSMWSILATDEQVNDIIESVINGNSAFQLIYTDRKIDNRLRLYSLFEFKVLKREDIKLEIGKYGNNLFSYDGGKRFQWREEETLLIDIDKIRDLKLNQILTNG